MTSNGYWGNSFQRLDSKDSGLLLAISRLRSGRIGIEHIKLLGMIGHPDAYCLLTKLELSDVEIDALHDPISFSDTYEYVLKHVEKFGKDLFIKLTVETIFAISNTLADNFSPDQYFDQVFSELERVRADTTIDNSVALEEYWSAKRHEITSRFSDPLTIDQMYSEALPLLVAALSNLLKCPVHELWTIRCPFQFSSIIENILEVHPNEKPLIINRIYSVITDYCLG